MTYSLVGAAPSYVRLSVSIQATLLAPRNTAIT
jgi:hypothetical protein